MPDAAIILFSGAAGLLVIGLGGLVLAAHLYRMLLALAIAEAGANLMLVLAGYQWNALAPIVTSPNTPTFMVDPVPQAMVLTAIVIGVGIQALGVALLIRIKRAYGTLNITEIKQRLDDDFSLMADSAPTSSANRIKDKT